MPFTVIAYRQYGNRYHSNIALQVMGYKNKNLCLWKIHTCSNKTGARCDDWHWYLPHWDICGSPTGTGSSYIIPTTVLNMTCRVTTITNTSNHLLSRHQSPWASTMASAFSLSLGCMPWTVVSPPSSWFWSWSFRPTTSKYFVLFENTSMEAFITLLVKQVQC